MSDRSLTQWVTNHLLLLHTIKESSQQAPLHKLRLQKIVFLTQYDSWTNQKETIFDYDFIKSTKDHPFSSELQENCRRLKQLGMVFYSSKSGYILPPSGYQILDQCKSIFDRNADKLQIIRQFVGIKDSIFEAMLVDVYEVILIKEENNKLYLLKHDAQPSDVIPFNIENIEAESLEIIFDSNLQKSIEIAEESIRNEPLTFLSSIE